VVLTGHRHKACHAPDGRLVVVFRDKVPGSPWEGHFVGWVGLYDDNPSSPIREQHADIPMEAAHAVADVFPTELSLSRMLSELRGTHADSGPAEEEAGSER
jgi:hypothetical protein